VVLRGRGASFYIQNDFKCARCKELNASGARFCGRCSLPLELEAALMEREVRGEVDGRAHMTGLGRYSCRG